MMNKSSKKLKNPQNCLYIKNLREHFISVIDYSVVNKQMESHKGSISYLHEVELVYNDASHSQPTLLVLSCYLSGFSGVLLRSQKSTHPT